MAKWIPAYPVDFTPEGDRTNQAIQKHITEIARIYDMIQMLRQNFVGSGFPSSPERNQLYINPNTLEAFTYVGLSGENDWRTIVTQSKRHTLDNHFSGTMNDLQQLVTDAFMLFLSSVPSPTDVGRDISIDGSGNVVMSSANKTHRENSSIHTDSATKAENAAHIANADIHTTADAKTASANHIADSGIHTTTAEKNANSTHRNDSTIHTDSATKTANANHIADSGIHTTTAEKNANTAHRENADIHVTTTDKLHWNIPSGVTASRPSSGNWVGRQYFDTTLGKPIWWNGTKWILADGSDA